MHPFNAREKALLHSMSTLDSKDAVSMQKLLEGIFFTEKEGRALIIQTVDHYVVFFLNITKFEDENVKKQETIRFLEVVALLQDLKKERYITLLPSGRNRKEESMYFVQDAFMHPEPGTGRIILNKEGDYTHSPESIFDKDNHIIYKGIFFDRETYDFLTNNLESTVLISDRFEDLVKENNTADNNKTKTHHKWGTWVFRVCTVILFAIALYFFWGQMKQHQSGLNDLVPSKKVSTPKKRFYGIDISRYNGRIVDKINVSGTLAFVICKATEGEHFRDPNFNYNWKSIKGKKLIRGAYHFFHTNTDPIKQAKNYISTVGKWEDTDIAPIVDIEAESLSKSEKVQTVKEIENNLLEFLNEIKERTNRVPMIYTGKAFANDYLLNKTFSKYPLWLAEYDNREQPILPSTWKDVGFKVWQKSDKYRLKSSVDDSVYDLDIFEGEQLLELYN